jgi:hypothetical protein
MQLDEMLETSEILLFLYETEYNGFEDVAHDDYSMMVTLTKENPTAVFTNLKPNLLYKVIADVKGESKIVNLSFSEGEE